MTTDDLKHAGGKGFAPTERNVGESRGETAATATHGSGKQFAMDVGDPDSDERARHTEGSGKKFSWAVLDAEEEMRGKHTKGSGKQFAPGHHEL